MDPLSVMASVVGLLTAAGNVSSILSAVKSSMKDTPQLVHYVLSEVKEVEISLSAIHRFLLGIASAPRRRTALIQVGELIATLTEAVLTFSELEALVAPLAMQSKISTVQRLQWAWKEDVVSSIMQRLQRHKSSLSLMLNIVQCGSDLEAEQSRETLQGLVELLLESSNDISRRLRSIEGSCDSQSTLTKCVTNGSADFLEVDNSTLDQDAMDLNKAGLNSFDFQFPTTQLSFENDLKLSRVYSRTQLYESDVSFTSSAVRTHAWSVYSGLSLAEASAISAVALPLYSHDISNSQWYKFGGTSQTDTQPTIPMKKIPSTVSTARNTLKQSTSAVSKIRDYASEISRFPRRKSEPPGRKEASNMKLYKLVVLGDGGVGKDELVTQFYNNQFVGINDLAIENLYRMQISIDGEPCMLEVLDAAGQEHNTALRDRSIRGGQGFLLVYSVCSRLSFTKIRKFHRQVNKVKDSVVSEFFNRPYLPMMLVGNKCDRVTEREVSTQEGLALARELACEFVEASAKNCINVEEAFYDLVRLIRMRRK